jgi:hypothetical protein
MWSAQKIDPSRIKPRRQSMTQSDPSYLVSGRLIDQQRILHEVELVITTKQLLGPNGAEDEAIFEIKFARRSPVPDGGPYTLRYIFKEKKHEDQVRVKQGALIAG